jgi:hypothetical protein
MIDVREGSWSAARLRLVEVNRRGFKRDPILMIDQPPQTRSSVLRSTGERVKFVDQGF